MAYYPNCHTQTRRAPEGVDRLTHLHEFDFIQEFAFPLPATVIMLLCGLPAGDMELLKAWSEKLKPFIGSATDSPEKYELAQQGAGDMALYFRDVVQERKNVQGQDIISRLLRKPASGEGLTDDEIIGTCMLFLFGGHETTTNLIGNGMRTLLKFPEARERLLSSPELIAVEMWYGEKGRSSKGSMCPASSPKPGPQWTQGKWLALVG